MSKDSKAVIYGKLILWSRVIKIALSKKQLEIHLHFDWP